MCDVLCTCQTTQRPTDTMTPPGELNQIVTAPDARTRVHIAGPRLTCFDDLRGLGSVEQVAVACGEENIHDRKHE